jgi:hypothetical protein
MRPVFSTGTYFLTYSMEQSPSWEVNRFSASQEFSRILWNPRFITALTSARHLSLSWASSVQSIPPHPTSTRFILMLSSHLNLGLPMVSYTLSFPHQNPGHASLPPYTLHAWPISFSSILSPEQYRVRSTDHSAPHYVVFPTLLFPHPS